MLPSALAERDHSTAPVSDILGSGGTLRYNHGWYFLEVLRGTTMVVIGT